ncbi:hypothetical protein COOONC_00206 [Cooperia oncophora]
MLKTVDLIRKKALRMLHCSHYGRNGMASLARWKVWYPEVDRDILQLARLCETCAVIDDPAKTPLHLLCPMMDRRFLREKECRVDPNVAISPELRWRSKIRTDL